MCIVYIQIHMTIQAKNMCALCAISSYIIYGAYGDFLYVYYHCFTSTRAEEEAA